MDLSSSVSEFLLPITGCAAVRAKRRGTRYSGQLRIGIVMETSDTIKAIERRIIELKQEHRDLDLAIGALVAAPVHDELQLKRLKKRKLLLKDQVSFLEAQLTPDIPA